MTDEYHPADPIRWKPDDRRGHPHHLWSEIDKDATELEVTELIAALVRTIKPRRVIETGTYHAHTTRAIAEAMRQNGVGDLLRTFDTDAERATAAAATFGRTDTGQVKVEVVLGALSTDLMPDGVELAFLDSCMRCRHEELQIAWPRLTPGALVIIHDAAPTRPPSAATPPGAHHRLDLATPRGLIILQKPWPAP